MALINPEPAWTTHTLSHLDSAKEQIERMVAEVSARYPNTGTSDVFRAVMLALDAARDKLRIEAANAERRKAYNRSEGA